MTLPILLRHDMVGAPQLTNAAGSFISVLTAALVNGFNTQSVSSATASGGVVTFNFASAPGFAALDTVTIAGSAVAAVNGVRRVQSAGSNQVLVAVPGVANGAVGGTMTLKFAPLGWTRPYTGTNLAAFRMGGGISQRFLRVADTVVGGSAFVRGYEAMTAISTGTGLFPTTAQAAGNGMDWYKPGSPGLNSAWLIVGDEKRFYFVSDIGADVFLGGDSTAYASFFGQLSNVVKAADVYAAMLSPFTFPSGCFLPRRYTGVGTSATVEIRGIGAVDAMAGAGTYPNPADVGVVFTQSGFVCESASADLALRGTMPGLLEPLCNTKALANGAVLTGVTGVAGRLLMIKSDYVSMRAGLLLDEDWA